jgi:hypothetical protein
MKNSNEMPRQLQHVTREIATAITDKIAKPDKEPGEPGVTILVLKGTKGADHYEYRRMVNDDGKTIGKANILKNGTALEGDVSADYASIKQAFGLEVEDTDKSEIEKAALELKAMCIAKKRKLTINEKGDIRVSPKSKKVA